MMEGSKPSLFLGVILGVEVTVTSSMPPGYDMPALLSKWDSRRRAIAGSGSQTSPPLARPWPTCHPFQGLQEPLQSPGIPSQRVQDSPGHLSFKTSHMNLLG